MVAEIETLWRVDAWNAECDSWEQQAVDSAQRLDSGPPASQVAPLTRLKNEALRELRRLLAPVRHVPGDHRPDWEIEADEFVAGLTPLGHPSLRDPEFRNDE